MNYQLHVRYDWEIIFQENCCMLKKLVLWVGLIEPKTVIDYLSIKLHAGNKISKGELTRVINIHEDMSEDDSGLPIRVRRKKIKFKYWKVGWIEEIEDKLRERNIEIIDEDEKVLVATSNKF